MSYHVRTDGFTGPFDLLLYLVARKKVDIGAISIGDITDQYLAYIERMEDLDLDVASDFLVVAAQLLEIKSASLLPAPEPSYGDELDDLDPDDAREILIARLINYRKFKSAALHLGSRHEAESRMHPRTAGLEPQFTNLMPDYLEEVTLRGLAVICADLDSRRETFLLEAEHIAAMPIPVELHVESIKRELSQVGRSTFSKLAGEGADIPTRVVTFLALLELYKRKVAGLEQERNFSEIEVVYLGEGEDGDEEGQDDPLMLDKEERA